MELNQALVRQLFEYLDGTLVWKVTNSNRAKAGTIAGTEKEHGYRSLRINRKPFHVHRIIFLWHHGYLPNVVDHIDGNPRNNCIENLREATFKQNQGNRRKSDRGSTPKGVDWKPRTGKWQARITINGKQKYLGVFATAEDAHAAYTKAAGEYFGVFARTS